MKNLLDKKPFIIAEVGSNWKRSNILEENLALARRHIYDASLCGVNAVKFQFFTHRELYGVDGPNDYNLPSNWLPILAHDCARNNVEFMCSAFSEEGLKYVDSFVNIHKIASSEALHLKLLEAAKKTGKPFLVSNSGLTDQEYLQMNHYQPTAVLICSAKSPAKTEDYSLSFPIGGLSDHTLDETLALMAIGCNASIFEKHFDALSDFKGVKPSPDSSVSVGPQALERYCTLIRRAYYAFANEVQSYDPLFKSRWQRRLKVTKPLKAGQDILEYGINFGIYRSLNDDSRAAGPLELSQFQGKRVKREMKPQDGLWFDDIE